MTTLQKEKIATLPSLSLTERQLYDLEMLLIGGFSPLSGFLDEKDYLNVLNEGRLANGSLWPIPVTLDTNEAEMTKQKIQIGSEIVLRDVYNTPIAFLVVTSLYTPDKKKEAQMVYGTTDTTHPGVHYLFNKTGSIYIGGPVTKIQLPHHYDFQDIRLTPKEVRDFFTRKGIRNVVAFQTRNPIHRAHYELIKKASTVADAHVLVHPVVGPTKEGDIDYVSRVQGYKALVKRHGDGMTLSLLPLAMRMAGPREALWHALIRKNYGATHFIVGRDHAGPGKDRNGEPFYGQYDAQELVKKYSREIGIEILAFPEQVYHSKSERYVGLDEVKKEDEAHILTLSGTEFRKKLLSGEEIPSWFSFPEVIGALRTYMPKRGRVVLFTGLSGSGKSTLALALKSYIEIENQTAVTFLDGDVIRKHLTEGLGFSKEDRIKNVRRVGYVAAEIAKHGGTVLVSLVSPYEEVRMAFRHLVEPYAVYREVFVTAPLEVLKVRDTKGYYTKASLGQLTNLTGVQDPYEEPKNPDLVIDTGVLSLQEASETLRKFM